MKKLLIGNAYPTTLIGRRVVSTPEKLETFKSLLKTNSEVRSFWGHANTLEVAEEILGISLKPAQERPALYLDGEGFPCLDGEKFTECWLLTPVYRVGFRPQVGQEIHLEDILDWQVVKMVWE